MGEAVRRTKTTRRKPPEKPSPGPTQEELINAEVERRVSAIIDIEAFERQMLRNLTSTISCLCESRCTEHPFPNHVEAVFNDALSACFERVERIARNDRPPIHVCNKCGD